MPSKLFFGVALAAAIAGIFMLQPWAGDSYRPATFQRVAYPQDAVAVGGYNPLAPPTANPKTQVGRDFAAQVDEICVVTYNRMEAASARAESKEGRWSDRRIEARRLGLSADQGAQILFHMSKLGPPPERADVWAQWREFMAKRASIKARASLAAAEGRWFYRAHLMNRTYRMKDRQDIIGRRLGLSACASG